MKTFGSVKTVSPKCFAARILDINTDCAEIDSPAVCRRELRATCLLGASDPRGISLEGVESTATVNDRARWWGSVLWPAVASPYPDVWAVAVMGCSGK